MPTAALSLAAPLSAAAGCGWPTARSWAAACARAGTTLSGTGQLGATTIDAGATHAPGNPTGAQAIAGDYVNRGTLLITATPAAQSRLDVAGRVDIADATLDLRLSPDDAAAWQPQAGPLC